MTPLDEHTGEMVAAAVAESAATLREVIAAVERLDAAGLAAPSVLPGWSRGHVLAHIDGNGRANARQVEYAARGALVEQYDGGRAGREAAIEAGATRSREEHLAALRELEDRLAAAWPPPGSPVWSAPIVYRDGTVVDAALGWWREVSIHAVDLDAGIGPDAWSTALCEHLLDFLSVRLPEAGGVILVADDEGVRYAVGAGLSPLDETPLEITGTLRGITAVARRPGTRRGARGHPGGGRGGPARAGPVALRPGPVGVTGAPAAPSGGTRR